MIHSFALDVWIYTQYLATCHYFIFWNISLISLYWFIIFLSFNFEKYLFVKMRLVVTKYVLRFVIVTALILMYYVMWRVDSKPFCSVLQWHSFIDLSNHFWTKWIWYISMTGTIIFYLSELTRVIISVLYYFYIFVSTTPSFSVLNRHDMHVFEQKYSILYGIVTTQ